MVAAVLLFAAAMVRPEVPVYLATDVAPDVLETALSEVDAIFEAGGIRFDWRISPEGALFSPPVVIVIHARPPAGQVHGCRRGLHDHRLGHTQLRSRRVTLWTEQVARAVAGEWDDEAVPEIRPRFFGRAIGRVLAHELGHLFLGLNGHHDRGLMRKSFSRRSLISRNPRSFRLPEKTLEAMRREIETRIVAAGGAR